MYFNIYDDVSIRNYNLKGKKAILIRILEPSYKVSGIPYIINNINQYKDILELYIEDTIIGSQIINKENVFDYEKAKILNDFILKNDFDEVVVHCSLGISRSPAIMICIAKMLNNSKLENIIKERYKFYNEYIVNVFERTNYSIKIVDTIDKIDGNVISKKYEDLVDDEFNKLLIYENSSFIKK